MAPVPINFDYHSGIYSLQVKQELQLNREEAWNFFSDPANLSLITPPKMAFIITNDVQDTIYPGQIISYRIRILPFLKTNWVTEITHVQVGDYFIDEQKSGPYSMWHHEHSFKETGRGIRVYDRVFYKVPFGLFGRILHTLFIKKQLSTIFSFRYQKLNSLFNGHVAN
jgi:ligand-binding SRPBCC domain-containing protein